MIKKAHIALLCIHIHTSILYLSYNIIDHQNTAPDHVCTANISDCFTQCENCRVKATRVTRPSSAPVRPLANISSNRVGLKKSPTYPEHLGQAARNTSEPLPPLQEVTDESTPIKPHRMDPQDYHTNKTDDKTPTHGQNDSLPPQKFQPEPEVAIHVLAPSLFTNEYPYKLFLGNYKILELIIVLFLIFQTLASIFITLCEDRGAFAVFHDGLNIPEFINRTFTLLLRGLVRIIGPFVFYRQICSMAEAEKALYVKVKNDDDYRLPSPKPVAYEKHVTLWSIISHATIFSIILLYLDAFLTAEDRLRNRGICIREILEIQVPIIGMKLFVFCDCLACFFILILVGLVKDCYCIENRLSVAENSKYFSIIRKRWYRIDTSCYIFSSIIILFTLASLSYKRPLIPAPDHELGEGDLEMWCFWMIGLSLLLFFGSSTNWIAKYSTVLGNGAVLGCVFIFTAALKIDKIKFPPGSFIILMYSHLTITTINLLYCLMNTHYRHKKHKSVCFWLSLVFWIMLILCLFAMVVREVNNLAYFIVWS